MNRNEFMLYYFLKSSSAFSNIFVRTFFAVLLVMLVLITKLLRSSPRALTKAAKTSLKALGDNLWRSEAATTSGELTIFLVTLSSKKSGAG